jgi:hypothetical protein
MSSFDLFKLSPSDTIGLCVYVYIYIERAREMCMYVDIVGVYVAGVGDALQERIYVCLFVAVCMCVCVYARMYACMYVCMYACMHACMYICSVCTHHRTRHHAGDAPIAGHLLTLAADTPVLHPFCRSLLSATLPLTALVRGCLEARPG